MAYFDNAATTYPKPACMYEFMDRFYRESAGNAGRGDYEQAENSGKLIEDTRNRIKTLLHCPSKATIFQPSATISLNVILQGLLRTGIKNIYVSPFEHNAVTRVLYHYEQCCNITVEQLKVTKDLKYDLEAIRYQFDAAAPDLVIISHASNVIGLIAPVEEIFLLAKRYDALTLVDMSQTAGLVDINVGLETFDFAVFAGHKTLYGPTGLSGFVMKPSVKLPTVLFGGTGFDSANQDMPDSIPQKYECGTMNISGVAGLNAALRWIDETKIEHIHNVEQNNRDRLIEVLSDYPFLKIVGNQKGNEYVSIVSCVIDGISSDSIGPVFAKNNIAVRTGLQCAPYAHKFLGTYPAGTIRFSASYFTNEKDFEELKNTLSYIADVF